jgi:hypothetical protein
MSDTTTGLELHLTFDDQSGTDSSGHNRTATLVAGPGSTWPKPYNIGAVGPALSFHALSLQYVSFPSLASGLGDNATFCCWAKLIDATPAFSQFTGLAHLGGLITNSGTHYPYTDGLGYFGIFRGQSNTTADRISGVVLPGGVERTQWHHICITTTPGTNGWKLYINGVLITTATGITGVYYDNDQWTIGKTSDPSFGDFYTNGAIDDVRIYSRTLSAPDIAAVMVAADTPRPDPVGNIIAPSCHFGLTLTYVPLSENNTEIGNGTENINRFNPPAHFTWDNWLNGMKRMGATDVFWTIKHCDGFCMWPSAVSAGHSLQNVSNAIHNRDLAAEFCDGARARDMDPSFYFAVGDNYLYVQNSGFGGNYTTKILGQITELMAYRPKFVVNDAWGSWWEANSGSPHTFPGYSDIPLNTVYDHYKAIDPAVLVGINNHNDLDGDMRVYEETVEGVAPANSWPTMTWRIVPRVDTLNIVNRWGTHADTLTEPLQPALGLAQSVQATVLGRGGIMAHNVSIGPDGRLTPDLQAIVDGIKPGSITAAYLLLL